MPIIPVGFGQLTFVFLIDGDTEEMLTSVGVDLSEAGGDFDAVVEGATATWAESFLLEQTIACTYVRTVLQVGQDGGDPLVFEDISGLAGLDPTGPLPPNVAYLMRKTTTLGGRAGRGRMFLPGIALQGEFEANGTVSDDKLFDMQTRGNQFFNIMASGNSGAFPDSALVLLHSGATPAPTTLTGLQAQRKLATQRRRLRP